MDRAWDDASLGGAALAGGWYAGTTPATRADFEKRFNDAYHYAPARLSTLGYDATALAVVIGKQGRSGQTFSLAAIEQPNGFAGVDGVFRFDGDGKVERRLSVLQIGPSGPTVVDAGSRGFQPEM